MKTAPTLESTRRFYDRLWRTRRTHQQDKNRMTAITMLFRRMNLQGVAILELGCGLGETAARLSRFGKVEAVDLSPRAIETAARRFPDVSFRAGDLFSLPFAEEGYDVVVCSELIEHLPSDRQQDLIRLADRCLAPGGHLILTTPNKSRCQGLTLDQPFETLVDPERLCVLVEPWFDVILLTSIYRLFPVWGHRSRVAQVLRTIGYELPLLRSLIENPERRTRRGLITLMAARKKQGAGGPQH